eukprot:scaffold3505_cov170-Amphora_coffeaeformis.AAC.11
MTSRNEQKLGYLERFAILHMSLQELSTGSGPDEGASVEELAESILYYYVAGSGSQKSEPKGRESGAAVRLAGLATAFWSLPKTITSPPSSPSNNQFQFVTLSNCTLLLTVLEHEILAVAQFSKDAHVTPQAMAADIRRHYRLFCLFGGGRIHCRLKAGAGQSEVMEDAEAYPGMKKLFELHHKKQKLCNRRGGLVKAGSELALIQSELDRIRSSLPITALQADLREHFDMFCTEWESLRATNPACGRSFIHQTPSPIPGTLSTRLLKRDVSLAFKEKLETVLLETAKISDTIWGIAVFAQGQFYKDVVSHPNKFDLDIETSCLAMYYLSSMRQNLPTDHEPAAAGFLRRTLGGLLQGERDDDSGTFLKPPPLSMLSTTVQEISYCSLGEELVWTPLLTLDDEERSVRVSLYNRGNYAFVIYLDPSKESGYSSALKSFATLLVEKIEYRPVSMDDNWDRVGQDILLLDRRRQTTILYSSRKATRRDGAMAYPDERYQPASLLSLDTLLALDDAMQQAILESPARYEMCTLLRHNWLVCRARDGRELFVVLDSKHYVTIQDVTVAVNEIEKHFVRN